MTVKILVGDCRARLADLPDSSVQTVVTSPPYYGLRNYGNDDQIGLEDTPEAYVAEMVAVFREVRRVLRDDGTLWLNLGDSYASGGGGDPKRITTSGKHMPPQMRASAALPHKQLLGIPWRVALALQADGWWLRSDIIWHKPNPMPESVTDRPTKAHEYVFLLTKSARYYYDADAVKTKASDSGWNRQRKNGKPHQRKCQSGDSRNADSGTTIDVGGAFVTRNRRDVWKIATKPYSGAHFAVMPPALVEPCIKAGTSERGACGECGAPWERVTERTPMEVRPGPSRNARSQNGQLRTQVNGTMTKPPTSKTIGWQPSCDCEAGEPVPCVVLDPFGGAGTVAMVSDRLGRDAVMIEINPEYAQLARQRIYNDAGMFADVEVMA